MREPTFVAYYRVSTTQQGRSGLGLDSQRAAVTQFLQGRGRLIREFVEIESGKVDDRPELLAAMATCDLSGSTLVVAFLAAQDSGAKFVATDMPEANELTIHIMAAVAQAERKAISQRTKEALAAAKARGVRLGGLRGDPKNLLAGPAVSAKKRRVTAQTRARKVLSEIERARSNGALSLREIAAHLNEGGFRASRGGHWSAGQVHRVLASISYSTPV